jgi:hypothetical protein
MKAILLLKAQDRELSLLQRQEAEAAAEAIRADLSMLSGMQGLMPLITLDDEEGGGTPD